MTSKLRRTIKQLHKAERKYEEESTGNDNNTLYIQIVGPAWRSYLRAGGSRTMINK